MEIRFLKRQAIGWKFSMGRTYSIDEADKTVTFRTEGSTFPNSEGEVAKTSPDQADCGRTDIHKSYHYTWRAGRGSLEAGEVNLGFMSTRRS